MFYGQIMIWDDFLLRVSDDSIGYLKRNETKIKNLKNVEHKFEAYNQQINYKIYLKYS